MADHMRTELVEDALTMAFANRAPEQGVIFHSDRGCQYTSGNFAELARANGVVLSVGGKGECWDNAVAESFFATIKRELIDTRAWPTRTGLRRAVFEYIEGWYNRAACTRRWAISARRNTKLSTTTPTVKRHNQHKEPVRRTGSSPSAPATVEGQGDGRATGSIAFRSLPRGRGGCDPQPAKYQCIGASNGFPRGLSWRTRGLFA